MSTGSQESALGLVANADITRCGTMRTPARTRWLLTATDESTLARAVAYANAQALPWFLLGGGSNVVLPEAFEGLVVRIASRGIRVLEESAEAVRIDVAAGEGWHDLVRRALGMGLSGLESMALIPGTAGAAPVQNIGAYGGELAAVFERARVLDAASGHVRQVAHADCAFGYRDSVFKRLGDGAIITSLVLRLGRARSVRARYADVADELGRMGLAVPTPTQYAEAVIRVRRRKLPDPRVRGNVGSFFKNPVLPADVAARLFEAHPTLRGLARGESVAGSEHVKLPAAALIERAGWKGRVDGPMEAWRRQPLVLVNRGGARRADVLATASRIVDDVRARFGVTLVPEPRLVFPGEG